MPPHPPLPHSRQRPKAMTKVCRQMLMSQVSGLLAARSHVLALQYVHMKKICSHSSLQESTTF